ncbi:MAG: hypothetical protein JWN24_4999 [Phycisphaerales bacterium]|nr:hypothetical protein [Phycisphaerales bacterium]
MRRFFTLLSALSLLLCVATCVLWVRGKVGRDELDWSNSKTQTDRTLFSANGDIRYVSFRDTHSTFSRGQTQDSFYYRRIPHHERYSYDHEFLQFGWYSYRPHMREL